MKIVPRFFPFFVTEPVTIAFESAGGGGEPETLDPSSTGTERLIPCLVTEARSAGIATGPVGARGEADESGPGSGTDGDVDSEAKEPSAAAAVCSTTGLGMDVSIERENRQVFGSRWTACGIACVAESSTRLSRR